MLNKEWSENSTIKLYSPSIFKIRTNLLYDEKDEVRNDINMLISDIEGKSGNNTETTILIRSFECMLRLFRVFCNDYGGIDLSTSESLAKS